MLIQTWNDILKIKQGKKCEFSHPFSSQKKKKSQNLNPNSTYVD